MMDLDLIKRPLVTEKTTNYCQYVFEVTKDANKTKIKNLIEELYKVKVASVNIIVQKGKTKIFKGRKGRRSDMKKAMVSLADGFNIDLTAEVK